jgi:ParB family chromosome partitioning protein
VARQSGLGRGLGALIPPGGASAGAPAGPGLQEIAVAAIRPNPYQPRDNFDEETLGSLADSIREVGILQPVLVRASGDGYELIAGERRWRAARRLGMQTLPALVRETDDNTALEEALVENLQREALNPLEEAAAYQQLIEDFSLTHDQVAARVGKSRASVSNMLRLLQLPPSIQKAVRDKQLTMGHARALLGSPDRSFQEALARRAIAEDLSVRAVEDAVRERADGEASEGAPSSGGSTGNRRLRPAGFVELEELLGEYLDTRVKISMGNAGKGKVTVEFGGLEDLERLYRLVTEGRPKVVAPATG